MEWSNEIFIHIKSEVEKGVILYENNFPFAQVHASSQGIMSNHSLDNGKGYEFTFNVNSVNLIVKVFYMTYNFGNIDNLEILVK